MERGEVRWYEFQTPDKRRPILILSRTSVINLINEVTIAPITSTVRGIPSEVALGIEDGLRQDCAVNLDHLQTVPKARIGRLISSLSQAKMGKVSNALCFALGMDDWIRSA